MKQAAYFSDGLWNLSNELFSSYDDAMNYAIDHGNPLKVIWPARFRLVPVFNGIKNVGHSFEKAEHFELELVVPE